MEREKRAVDMKWLSKEQAELVMSIWEPMPYTFNGEECECDNQDIFITPSSSQHRKAQAKKSFRGENQENSHPKQALQYPKREG